jgi:putative phosphoribosyl transferase
MTSMSPFWKRKEQAPAPVEEVHDPPQTVRREVVVAVDTARLPGDLVVPPDAPGIVVFAHGSGSSRSSPRNLDVARRLNDANLGTLLFDLLTPAESEDRSRVFDVELLGRRLIAVTNWLHTWPRIGSLPVAFFGASTGAAGALIAASKLGPDVAAIVSRGGRPDLAGEILDRVYAPTLLIVGGADPQVLELNREAQERMAAETRLDVIPGATHLFEEPGALEEVARLTAEWTAPRLAEALRENWPRRMGSLG